MKFLYVAERFNQARFPSWEHYLYDCQHCDTERWLRLSSRVGIFLAGYGRARIESLGLPRVEESVSLNMLPPAPQDVPWDWSRRLEWDGLVLVGRRVATAFGYSRLPLGTYSNDVFVIAHPSGLSRCWNDEHNIDVAWSEASDWLFLRKLARKEREEREAK